MGYHRFFAYLNLFIFSMLVLILGAKPAGLVRGLGRASVSAATCSSGSEV
ncbi:MAG: hypothetical protein U0263_09700 [Polyangiaceae bacterium]